VKNGMFVFDGVVHMFDLREERARNEWAERMGVQMQGMSLRMSNSKMPGNPNLNHHMTTVEEAGRLLFDESDTDMAVVCVVPLLQYWKDGGEAPFDLAASLFNAYPNRMVLTGGVDPIYQGVQGAIDEMERQVEHGARSIKFYQAQARNVAWRADDREIAYPLFEKAQELGLTFLQFHKGLPFGDQSMDDLHSTDIQGAAIDFPDLVFGIHHFGEPFFDETLAVAERFENIVMVMPPWFNEYILQPRKMLHRLGEALRTLGEDRLIYGSEGFFWPRLQVVIDALADLQMPLDLQDGYGYPEITRVMKEKIFGRNLARILGIDVDAKLVELGESAK
jgi:uncharacterized protein